MSDDEPRAAHLALQRVRTAGSAPQARRRRRTTSEAPSGRDPAPVGELLESLITAEGWQDRVAAGSVFATWSTLVGQEVAVHCVPETLHDGVLHVRTDSTAWATQVRLLTPQLLTKIQSEVGPDVVTQVVVAGPVSPTWKRGRRSVQGPGPRDTYG